MGDVASRGYTRFEISGKFCDDFLKIFKGNFGVFFFIMVHQISRKFRSYEFFF